MVHIRNWKKLTNLRNSYDFNITKAKVIHNPDINDMLGLRCKPEKIYYMQVVSDNRVVNNIWLELITVNIIIFPLAGSMQIGLARNGMDCQLVTPISKRYLNTPHDFLKFVKGIMDNSFKLILNNV
jgi:hypothetical protein